MFEKMFGYKSLSFIANCYIWDKTSEKTLSDLGVKYLQGISNQCIPKLDASGKHSHQYKRHYFGERNEFGQRYFIRNAFFEPSLHQTGLGREPNLHHTSSFSQAFFFECTTSRLASGFFQPRLRQPWSNSFLSLNR